MPSFLMMQEGHVILNIPSLKSRTVALFSVDFLIIFSLPYHVGCHSCPWYSHSINLQWYQIIKLSYFYVPNRNNTHFWHKPGMEKSEWIYVHSYVCYEYISSLKITDLVIILFMCLNFFPNFYLEWIIGTWLKLEISDYDFIFGHVEISFTEQVSYKIVKIQFQFSLPWENKKYSWFPIHTQLSLFLKKTNLFLFQQSN